MAKKFDYQMIPTNGVELRAVVRGEGPLVIMVHGFPESWYSWRHQIDPVAEAGYQVVALDVRGYGGSSKLEAIRDYAMTELVNDLLGVMDHFKADKAVLFGHDWGAPIVWNTAALHPERVAGVVGLSVPWLPAADVSATDLWRDLYADRFFYQTYFQPPGQAEAELDQDVRKSLRVIYYNLSGAVRKNTWLKKKPIDAKLMDGLEDPGEMPDWMTPDDLDFYTNEFMLDGFETALNRYRAQDIDFEALPELRGARITVPCGFIAGSKEIVLSFIPGVDVVANMEAHVDDLRLKKMIKGAGHWIQQEAPEETTSALLKFLKKLDG